MLDWHKAISDLGEQYIKEVHIVSVQNECKELLIVMQQQPAEPPTVYCVNDDSVFSYHPSSISSNHISHHSSLIYLYEPNASIMKAGCFAEIEQAFEVSQLAPNSHLFASDQAIEDFPGRKFRVTAVTSMNKQELKQALKDIRQANIAVRNFPMSVADLRKRLKRLYLRYHPHRRKKGADHLSAPLIPFLYYSVRKKIFRKKLQK